MDNGKASELSGIPGGPRLARALGRLAASALGELDRASVVEVLAAARRVESWAASVAARAAGVMAQEAVLFAHPGPQTAREENPAGEPARPRAPRFTPEMATRQRLDATAEEIALRLAVSRTEASRLMRLGQGITGTFTETGNALSRGAIDARKATELVTALDGAPGPLAWTVEQDLLPAAPGMTAAQLRRRAQQALIEADPEDAQRRHRRARAKRHVSRTRLLPDGMGALTAVLPAEDCVQIDQTLTTIARTARHAGDPRTTDQLRADGLLALTHAGILTGRTGVHGDPEALLNDSPSLGSAPGQPPARATAPPPTHDREELARPPRTHHPSTPPPIQSAFPDLPRNEIPEVAVISPLLARLLRRGSENLTITRPEIHVTVPWNVLLAAQRAADATGEDVPGSQPGVDARPSPATDPPGRDPSRQPPDARDPEDQPPHEELPFDRAPQAAAVLAGYGALTPEVAAALSAGGLIRRIITDPSSGKPVELGRTRYRPSTELVELVRARDATCARPGCSIPSHLCQIDHITPWNQGGRTDPHNLQPLCDRDHQLKTAGALHVTPERDGTTTWTTPSGHTYRRDATGTITLVRIMSPPSLPGRANGPHTPRGHAPHREDHRPERQAAAHLKQNDPPPF